MSGLTKGKIARGILKTLGALAVIVMVVLLLGFLFTEMGLWGFAVIAGFAIIGWCCFHVEDK